MRISSVVRRVAVSIGLAAGVVVASGCIVQVPAGGDQVRGSTRVAPGDGQGSSKRSAKSQYPVPGDMTYSLSLPISHPPFHEFHASWILADEVAYVYFEHRGSYRDTGSILPTVIREMRVQGLEPKGAPFCLFYDDPAAKPEAQLISRACIPIAGPRSPQTPLSYDVLPSRTIVNAVVSGPYPEVPRCYPKLLEYMEKFGWSINGPIREVYLVAPSEVTSPTDLVCEVQVPVMKVGSR